MRNFFGYIRVSTARQGEKGVSLQEQREAILRCSERLGYQITSWFEERETAAKRGRPIFNEMLKRLRKGQAHGVLIHKIDRSARNLRDWADLGELIDRGIEVSFANENLDLQSRGGRLSADIQAVVAADFIRNLREETRKGMRGRLRQGLLPFGAPIGYLNMGKGNPKEIDPVSGPLVKKAFQLYGRGTCSFRQLVEELRHWGLRNHRGGKVTRNGISSMLNNPFYIGLIHIKRTGETFEGCHQPLISKALFDRVQAVMRGKTVACTQRHEFVFQRLLVCQGCGHSLTGETHKGYIYYCCHTKNCLTTCVREERVEEDVEEKLASLRLTDGELNYVQQKVTALREHWVTEKDSLQNALRLRLGQVGERLNRLTDAFLDGAVERELFENKKASLLMERKDLEEKMAQLDKKGSSTADRVQEFLELANSAQLTYKTGLPDEKREILKTVTSNRTVLGKNVEITLSKPFFLISTRGGVPGGSPKRDRLRTLDTLVDKLVKVAKKAVEASVDRIMA